MLKRKINPETFEKHLREYRERSESHSATSIQGRSQQQSDPFIEPETGEIMNPEHSIREQSAPSHSREEFHRQTSFEPGYMNLNSSKSNPQNVGRVSADPLKQMAQTLTGKWGQLSSYLPYLFGLISLTSMASMAWTLNHRLDTFMEQIKDTTTRVEQVEYQTEKFKEKVLTHLEESDQIIEDIELDLEKLSQDFTKVESEVELKANSVPKPTSANRPIKKGSQGPTKLPIKYLGTGMNQHTYQVLIETPRGTRLFSVGDVVISDWRLSALENRQLLLTNSTGQRYLVPLERSDQ